LENFKGLKITKNTEIKGFLASVLAEEPLKDYPVSWDMNELFASVKD
jgi:hypothetical protein